VNTSSDWKQFWEQKSRVSLSDYEVDRLSHIQDQEIDKLAEEELINFIAPEQSETLLDAGCGTGINILRLHSRVKEIFGVDFSSGSLERCKRRIQEQGVKNASVQEASVTAIPLPTCSVDKILCMSVLHYLNDEEARQALTEFVRVVRPSGIIVFHVKNLSSLYWATLRPAKKLKALLKKGRLTEHVRDFQWYADALASLGCSIMDYDSFNLFMVDVMPEKVVSAVRGFEVKHHRNLFFRNSFVRRHGAELMIKARVPGSMY
jgi:ubiquinone/menaquinone biosynthesis C-methylase UbiE